MRGGRLAWYRAEADAAHWDAHWRDTLRAEHYRDADAGRLGRFESVFTRYLPQRGRILEAGCGTGYYVAALRARGYEAQGVEWGERTVAAVRELRPGLPVTVGDVTALDEPNGVMAGYISLGVMEHREAGPGPFLAEAVRLLRPGGVALISVPNLHGLRRLKAGLGLYRGDPAGRAFYQYAYPREQFQDEIEAAGLVVEATQPYDGFKGIKDEVPGARPVLGLLKKSRLTKPRLERCRWGHMMMYVCRKPGGGGGEGGP
jgi:SAM-dependent methyltransferase